MTAKFQAVGLMLPDSEPRLTGDGVGWIELILDLELFSWEKVLAIQQFTSSRQSETAARLLLLLALSGRYICVSSA